MNATAKPRTFTAGEVEFDVEIGQEDTEPDFSEPEDVAWVHDQLARGNDWAWFWVRVTARVDGVAVEGEDSLGGCSYRSRRDFEENLLPEMKANALGDLNAKVAALVRKIAL